MHPELKKFLILAGVIFLISGGLLASRFGWVPQRGRLVAALPTLLGPPINSCVDDVYNRSIVGLPNDDFNASLGADISIQQPPLYTPPAQSNMTGWAADGVNYFDAWQCSSPTGIRYIRKLGIAPLGTHDENIWKDSLVMSHDAKSGGFPQIYFTQGYYIENFPKDADGRPIGALYPSMFALKKAFYNTAAKKWFITDILNQPNTIHGIAAQDGTRDDFIFNDYQIGPRRADWRPGFGPVANKPGSQSKIPGVAEQSTGYGIPAYALYGTGSLGLTSIIMVNPLPDYGAEVGYCSHDNPSLFDYDTNGSPKSFVATLYRQGPGGVASPCPLPNGESLPPGDYVYRFKNQEEGWQLDRSAMVPDTSGGRDSLAVNYIHGSDGKFLTAKWSEIESKINLVDMRADKVDTILDCSAANPTHAPLLGEPSGSGQNFIFILSEWPYGGPERGLDNGVFVHDIYLASTTDIHPESTGSDFIAPAIIGIYRDILGRDPDFDGAYAWTNQLRNGISINQIRNFFVDTDEARNTLTAYYQRILNRQPTDKERQADNARLKGGASIKNIIRNLAEASCNTSAVPGDTNGDGKVNILDFNIVASHFGEAGTNTPGDTNHDGKVDILDFGMVVSHFGQ